MKKVTLQVDGRELSLEEVEAIVREHFSKKEAKPVLRPTEGVPFEVNPSGIDRKLFQEKRKGENQEKTRQLILEALDEVKQNPDRYGKSFKTLIPVRTWDCINVFRLKEIASKLGDHMADWIEQALEWAQRIQNGESWETISNEADTANCFRLIEWKNGYCRCVGGSRELYCKYPASYIGYNTFGDLSETCCTVPLIVIYK